MTKDLIEEIKIQINSVFLSKYYRDLFKWAYEEIIKLRKK